MAQPASQDRVRKNPVAYRPERVQRRRRHAPFRGAGRQLRMVLVDDGDEVRTIALIPNLIVSYSTAKKL
jgi:hypothetical protein